MEKAKAALADYDYSTALKILRSELQKNKNEPAPWCMMFDIYITLGRVKEATEVIENASLHCNSPDIAHRLFFILERSGDNKKLSATIDRFSASDHNMIKANVLYYKGLLDLSIGQLDSAEKNLQQCIDSNSIFAAAAQKELGTIHEKKGNYDLAFKNFLGSKLRQLNTQPEVKRKIEIFDKNFNAFMSFFKTNSAVRNFESDFIPLDYDVHFLCGFPRSGTSLTHKILGSHDKIVVSDEFDFLAYSLKSLMQKTPFKYPTSVLLNDKNLIQELRNNFQKLIVQYFGNVKGKKVLIKMPQYLIYLPVLTMIFPEAKFINLKRNPYDTVLSCLKVFFEPSIIVSSMVSVQMAANTYERCMMLNALGQEVLNGQDKVMNVHYEKLINDFDSTVNEMCRFIGLEFQDKMREFYKSEEIILSASYEQVKKPIYTSSLDKWKNYEKFFTEAKPILDKFL